MPCTAGDLLRIIALFFIIHVHVVNSTGVYLRNITSPALTLHCGGTQKVTAPHTSPAIPRPSPWVVGGQWLQMTGALQREEHVGQLMPAINLSDRGVEEKIYMKFNGNG